MEKRKEASNITFIVQLFGFVTPQLLGDLVSFHNL